MAARKPPKKPAPAPKAPPVTTDFAPSGDRLVCFLYILARDHLPVGVLHKLAFDSMSDLRGDQAKTEARKFVFTNKHLEADARELAAGLMRP